MAVCPIRGHAHEITIIAEELVSNACAYSRKDSTIEIGLSTAGKFTVRDGGRGMTPDQLAQLGAFRQFDRQRFEQQGLGLGCELVQRLVARQQATFDLESQPGVGTVATVGFKTV